MVIPWLIFITFVIILIQSLIYTRWGLSRIRYSRFFSQEALFEGEEMEMIEEIANNKLLPIPWLRLESKISSSLQFQKQFNLDIKSEQFHRSLFSLMPYQKITRRHKVTCTKRGYFWLDTIAITSGDAFGFGQVSETVKVSADVLVYPKLIPLDEIPLPSHSWQGDIKVRRWIVEDPFTIAGVRKYAAGDPMNAINWKATAREGALQVSKKDYTADHHLMIYLNFDLTEDIWMPITDEPLMEKGISYAASIAEYTVSKGISTGFGCNSYLIDPSRRLDEIKQPIRIEPQNSKNHLIHLFDTMAGLAMDRSLSFNHFLKQDVDRQIRNTDILFITSFVSQKVQGHIRNLENQGNVVEILRLENEGQVKEHSDVTQGR